MVFSVFVFRALLAWRTFHLHTTPPASRWYPVGQRHQKPACLCHLGGFRKRLKKRRESLKAAPCLFGVLVFRKLCLVLKSLFGLFFRPSFYSDNKYSAQGQSAFVWGNVGFVGPLGPRTDSGGRIVFSVFSALPLVSGRTKTVLCGICVCFYLYIYIYKY